MIDYLKGVKENNLVIIAIKDSTWPWHWKQEWIDYVERLGSRTHQNTSERIIDDERGCPFTACKLCNLKFEIKTWTKLLAFVPKLKLQIN